MSKATSAHQVRDWLDTVLNPVMETLEEERAWLARGRTTFRHHTRDLEGISTTRATVGLRFERNLDQIRRYEPELAALFDRRDEARDALAEAACRAFDVLSADDGVAGILADVPPAERPYLLEYLIDAIETLPHHYSLREVWAAKRPELLTLWNQQPDLEAARVELEDRRAAMTAAAEALATALDERIAELADAHQLAPVRRIVA